jgi:Phage terminase, small subunit
MGFANSGRRPKPTSLKALQGVTRRDRLNPREPKPPPGPVRKPPGLSKGATRVWNQTAPVCEGMGTLTRADVKAFAMYCELEARVDEARRGLAQPKTVEASTRLLLQCGNLLRSYYALFGLEPASRARIQVPATAAPNVWLDKLA